jgi:dsDNA-binding SOS-regulon protein
MARIVKEIKEADEMLSVRNILTEMIDELATEEPARWIEELEITVAEAREALARLERLHDALSELAVELEEAKWIKKYF